MILSTCTTPPQEGITFQHKVLQETTKRSVDSLNVLAILNLEDLGILSASSLDISGSKIYISSINTSQIHVLDVQDEYKLENTISFTKGRGPGEIERLQEFAITENKIIIIDSNQQKKAEYNLDGAFINEVRIEKLSLNRLGLKDENNLVIVSMFSNDYVFHKFDYTTNEITSFQPKIPGASFLTYTGLVKYIGDYIYFAGVSEPIIKKYNAKTGELIYSREVIDGYESSVNYITSASGDFNMAGYASGALFTTEGLDVYGDFIFNSRSHNQESGYKYIDMYNAENGNYLKSFKTVNYPDFRGLKITPDIIYSLETSKNGQFLVMYENKLQK